MPALSLVNRILSKRTGLGRLKPSSKSGAQDCLVFGWLGGGGDGAAYELLADLSRGCHRLCVVGPGWVGDEGEVVVQWGLATANPDLMR